jgi:hypothetical protein
MKRTINEDSIPQLAERLRTTLVSTGGGATCHPDICDEAADVIDFMLRYHKHFSDLLANSAAEVVKLEARIEQLNAHIAKLEAPVNSAGVTGQLNDDVASPETHPVETYI